MKVAAILTIGASMLVPSLALAQSRGADATTHGPRADGARAVHATGASPARAASDQDRAIDAESRRIDRIMTICTGC